MHAYRSSRTLPRIGAAFATSLTLLALSGDPARAAGASLYGEGLHIASGRSSTPDGRTLVSDHNARHGDIEVAR